MDAMVSHFEVCSLTRVVILNGAVQCSAPHCSCTLITGLLLRRQRVVTAAVLLWKQKCFFLVEVIRHVFA